MDMDECFNFLQSLTKVPLDSVELFTKAMGDADDVGWAAPKKLAQVPGRSFWEISLEPSVRHTIFTRVGKSLVDNYDVQ